MAKNGYKVTRSNYTLKEFHKNAPDGAIYERDFMTTENLSGWRGGMFPHGENGFKMTFNETPSGARKHYFGEYLKNASGDTSWTLASGATKGEAQSEGKIVLKSDNSTLLSYAYYGSCTELIKSSIRDIIEKYPAEAFSTDQECTLDINFYSGCTYILNNDFGIDFMSDGVNASKASTPLRDMNASFSRYFINSGQTPCGCASWRTVGLVMGELDPCATKTNGGYDYYTELKAINAGVTTADVLITRCYYNGQPLYLTNTPNLSIKPSPVEIDAAFENFDDFERLLLNRESNPLYTAELDFPHETERGIETYRKRFTWPLNGDWNLDISSVQYEEYVRSLLGLADFYDSYRTDNLWRMMTHDSIKNMDITFSRSDLNEDADDYNEGTTKIQGLLWAYGRLFDEIKRSIDNIRAANNVTYDGQNNLPDYFLSDSLGLSGWEVSNSTEGLDKNAKVTFEHDDIEYGVVDANVRFLSNLKINSKSILSRKGTRYGIEMALGLFGYKSQDFAEKLGQVGDYELSEYVYVTSAKTHDDDIIAWAPADDELSAEKYGTYRENSVTDVADNEAFNPIKGLPVDVFYYNNNDGELWKTIIPWFGKPETLDGNPYFQMNGGWGKLASGIYSETINYLSISPTIAELTKIRQNTLKECGTGCYCYVTDISDFDTYFPNETSLPDEQKHYFVLYDVDNVEKLGEDGWNPIKTEAEIERKNYLEKVVDEYRGNNPHIGYGNYDDGEEFIKYLEKIFKGAIDSNSFRDEAYDCDTGEVLTGITEQGFNVEEVKDNKKCWYFYDKDKYPLDDTRKMEKLTVGDDGYNYDSSQLEYVACDVPAADVRDESIREDDSNTIFAEPSIVNSKKFELKFKTRGEDETEFIKKAVLPYVKQIVPSTAIFEISFENR